MAALSERDLETAGGLATRLIAVEEKSPVGRLTLSVVAARKRGLGQCAVGGRR